MARRARKSAGPKELGYVGASPASRDSPPDHDAEPHRASQPQGFLSSAICRFDRSGSWSPGMPAATQARRTDLALEHDTCLADG